MRIIKSKLVFEVEIATNGSCEPELRNLRNLTGAFLSVLRNNTEHGAILIQKYNLAIIPIKDEE